MSEDMRSFAVRKKRKKKTRAQMIQTVKDNILKFKEESKEAKGDAKKLAEAYLFINQNKLKTMSNSMDTEDEDTKSFADKVKISKNEKLGFYTLRVTPNQADKLIEDLKLEFAGMENRWYGPNIPAAIWTNTGKRNQEDRNFDFLVALGRNPTQSVWIKIGEEDLLNQLASSMGLSESDLEIDIPKSFSMDTKLTDDQMNMTVKDLIEKIQGRIDAFGGNDSEQEVRTNKMFLGGLKGMIAKNFSDKSFASESDLIITGFDNEILDELKKEFRKFNVEYQLLNRNELMIYNFPSDMIKDITRKFPDIEVQVQKSFAHPEDEEDGFTKTGKGPNFTWKHIKSGETIESRFLGNGREFYVMDNGESRTVKTLGAAMKILLKNLEENKNFSDDYEEFDEEVDESEVSNIMNTTSMDEVKEFAKKKRKKKTKAQIKQQLTEQLASLKEKVKTAKGDDKLEADARLTLTTLKLKQLSDTKSFADESINLDDLKKVAINLFGKDSVKSLKNKEGFSIILDQENYVSSSDPIPAISVDKNSNEISLYELLPDGFLIKVKSLKDLSMKDLKSYFESAKISKKFYNKSFAQKEFMGGRLNTVGDYINMVIDMINQGASSKSVLGELDEFKDLCSSKRLSCEQPIKMVANNVYHSDNWDSDKDDILDTLESIKMSFGGQKLFTYRKMKDMTEESEVMGEESEIMDEEKSMSSRTSEYGTEGLQFGEEFQNSRRDYMKEKTNSFSDTQEQKASNLFQSLLENGLRNYETEQVIDMDPKFDPNTQVEGSKFFSKVDHAIKSNDFLDSLL